MKKSFFKLILCFTCMSVCLDRSNIAKFKIHSLLHCACNLKLSEQTFFTWQYIFLNSFYKFQIQIFISTSHQPSRKSKRERILQKMTNNISSWNPNIKRKEKSHQSICKMPKITLSTLSQSFNKNGASSLIILVITLANNKQMLCVMKKRMRWKWDPHPLASKKCS